MRTCLSLFIAGAMTTLVAHAQGPMTEAEALLRLSPDSPRVRAIRAQVGLARADVAGAARFPNPRATWDREAVAGVAENLWLIAQPLPVGGRRQAQIASAAAALRASEFTAAELERRVRAEMREAFADLREQQIRERELAALVRRLSELAGTLARREAAGDAAGFDRVRAEREVLDVEAEFADARARRGRAQAALASFFARPADPASLQVATEIPPAPELPATEALLARAESTRGDLLALNQEVEAARFTRRAADKSLVPQPEVVGGMKTSTLGGGDRGSVLSLAATLPLFDRFRPERERAEAREGLALAQLDAARVQLRAEIGAVRQAVVDRRAAAESFRRAAVPKAEELQQIAQVSYDAGERGILELLDAYRSSAQARIRQAALDVAVARAESELEVVSTLEIRR